MGVAENRISGCCWTKEERNMKIGTFKRLLLAFSLVSVALTTLAGCVVYDPYYYGGPYYRGYYYGGYYRPGYSDYRNNRWRE
jgi:hypothetical protein